MQLNNNLFKSDLEISHKVSAREDVFLLKYPASILGAFQDQSTPIWAHCPFTGCLVLVSLLSLSNWKSPAGTSCGSWGKSNINYWIFRHLVWSASEESYSSPERGWRTWTQTQTFTGLSFRWTPTLEFFIFWFLLVFCNLKMKHSNIHCSPLLVDLLLPVLITL